MCISLRVQRKQQIFYLRQVTGRTLRLAVRLGDTFTSGCAAEDEIAIFMVAAFGYQFTEDEYLTGADDPMALCAIVVGWVFAQFSELVSKLPEGIPAEFRISPASPMTLGQSIRKLIRDMMQRWNPADLDEMDLFGYIESLAPIGVQAKKESREEYVRQRVDRLAGGIIVR